MSRTGEVVLGVISAIFTVIAIIMVSLLVVGGNAAFQDDMFTSEIQQEIMNDPSLVGQEEVVIEGISAFMDVFGVLGWGFVIALVISLILNVIGIVAIAKNKNSKLAGIMFIVAGLLAGVISLTSILLYVAGIMCFVRKPPVKFAEQEYYSPEQPM